MAHQHPALPDLFSSAPVRLAAVGQPFRAPSRTGIIVRGRAEVIAIRPLLVALARRTGQSGTLDEIDILVKHPTALRKLPCLVLVGPAEGTPIEQLRVQDLQGAVLFYEYVLGLPTGVFATDDISGERTALAEQSIRAELAEQACHLLIARGAAVCLATVSDLPAPGPRPVRPSPDLHGTSHVAIRTRTQPRDLELGPSLDATLALFGKHTRRNFRLARRRAEAELGVTFVPSVRIAPEEFMELNRYSARAVPPDEAAWRYHFAASSPQRLFAGMRDRDGRWLSIIAGTRYPDHTYIEWQLNRTDLPRYSLSTVMRSFLLEHESRIGTRKLLFKGGTPHSMGLSLKPAETLDILVVRRGLRGYLLRHLSRWILPRSNFLGRVLEDDSLSWIG